MSKNWKANGEKQQITYKEPVGHRRRSKTTISCIKNMNFGTYVGRTYENKNDYLHNYWFNFKNR